MNFTSFITANEEVFVYKGIKITFDLSGNNQRDALCSFSTSSSRTIIEITHNQCKKMLSKIGYSPRKLPII